MANSFHAPDKNAKETVKRFESHEFADEDGAEYGGSSFGGFGEYFHNKKIKLQNKNAHIRQVYKAEDAPQLFKGMAMYVNGYTQPSLNDLNIMIVRHGGVFLQYMDGKTQVTHIIATALTPKKKVEFAKYKIVKPAWIVESIEAGVLLSWTDYRVVEESQSQSLLGFGGFKANTQTQSQGDGKILSQKNRPNASYREFTGKPKSTATRFISRSGDDGPPSTVQSFGSPVRETAQMTSQQPSSPLIEEEEEGGDAAEPQSHQTGSSNASLDEKTEEEETLQDSHLILPNDLSSSDKPDGPPIDPLRSSQDPFKDDDERLLALDKDTQMEDVPSPDQSESPVLSEEAHEEFEGPDTELADLEYPSSPAHKKAKLTALENNTKLLSNPKIRQNTVLNPEFLTKYYSESRLHHLSQWKAELKAYFQSLTSQTARRSKPSATSQRYILHVDFDCFFASVSAKTRPDLAGKPVGVGHSSGPSSEIASCNYVARESGVKNGMWMKQASELCPNLVILPYDFPAYETASKAFYSVLMGTGASVVQSVSIDEALLDITHQVVKPGRTTEQEHELVFQISKDIRDGVRSKTGCEVSVGAGANVLLAKLALRKAKPAGQYHLKPDEFAEFVAPLKVRDLPGVGYHLSQKIQEDLKIETVGELREVGKERLKSAMGPKTGEKLFEYARGIDKQDVGDVSVRKSVTVDVNWGVRFETATQVTEFMYNLASELCRRLSAQNLRGSHLTLKLMKRASDAPLNPPKYLGHGHCDTFNKSAVLGVATNDKDIIGKEMCSILKTFSCPPEEIRGLGITMTKLVPANDSVAGSSQKRLDFGKRLAVDPPAVSSMPPPPPALDKGKRKASPPPLPQENRTPIKLLKPTMPSILSQFLVPTQVDQSVLESLPDDMKSKILEEQQRKQAKKGPSAASPINIRSKDTLNRQTAFTQLPAQSQIDPSVLDELPADIRAEILAQYKNGESSGSGTASSASGSADKPSLPQTPQKNRWTTTAAGPSSAKKPTPIKSKAAPSVQPVDIDEIPASTPPEALGIDPTFLAELPPEIREEVIAQARADKRRAEAKAAALATAKKNLARPPPAAEQRASSSSGRPNGPQSRRTVPIPVRNKSILQGSTTLHDVRNLMTNWHNAARTEGPHIDDVEDVVTWLRSVVRDDRDIDKAIGAVKWLGWVVGEADGHVEWEVAVEMCRDGIRDEAEKRGMVGIDI
ncbi:DNA repair protein rev1 [Drechslerella dactyloides]|uniref:DNA repair protein REV1 n=1 Tax=Drechslerella dactyloides TaxID=74499 RepID=A0AAD6NLR3_DREDA|nr:DNA repair protein rev1 [Drechslerella dactyloides]